MSGFTNGACAVVASVAAAMLLVGTSGCNFVGFAGAMVETYRRSSTKTVKAEYDGLREKSYGVIVTGDRVLQGSYPTLLPRLQARITDRLADPNLTGVKGVVPPVLMLEFQLTNSTWSTWNYEKVANELGVERLIIVEMYEYRLNEPGNSYTWEGVATARVNVVEADGPMPTEFSFTKDVSVRYPDKPGFTPDDLNQQQVQSVLEGRLIDRVTWLFHDHEEPYYPDY